MTRQEFHAALEELVELPAGTLQGGEKIEDLEGWNSMAMVGFVALADDHGVKLSPRQVAASVTIDDLFALLQPKG